MKEYVTTSNTSDNAEVGRFSYDNFVTIWGFARGEFNLKGFELLVYSIIFGYYKNGHQTFTGSRKYLENWTGGSRSTIESALASLEGKELIVKEYRRYGSITKAVYHINTEKLPTHPMFELENLNRDISEKQRKREKQNSLKKPLY